MQAIDIEIFVISLGEHESSLFPVACHYLATSGQDNLAIRKQSKTQGVGRICASEKGRCQSKTILDIFGMDANFSCILTLCSAEFLDLATYKICLYFTSVVLLLMYSKQLPSE
jgi:hypothetical protein